MNHHDSAAVSSFGTYLALKMFLFPSAKSFLFHQMGHLPTPSLYIILSITMAICMMYESMAPTHPCSDWNDLQNYVSVVLKLCKPSAKGIHRYMLNALLKQVAGTNKHLAGHRLRQRFSTIDFTLEARSRPSFPHPWRRKTFSQTQRASRTFHRKQQTQHPVALDRSRLHIARSAGHGCGSVAHGFCCLL